MKPLNDSLLVSNIGVDCSCGTVKLSRAVIDCGIDFAVTGIQMIALKQAQSTKSSILLCCRKQYD